MLELLLSLTLFSVAILACVELLVAVSSRISIHSRRLRALHAPEQFALFFASSVDSALECSIYPNRIVFDRAPALRSDEGNFVVLTARDGAQTAFELSAGTLRVSTLSSAPPTRERIYATNIPTNGPLCALRGGAPTHGFEVPSERGNPRKAISGMPPLRP